MSEIKTPNPLSRLPIPLEFIERRIYLIRGQQIMLDRDLADLYQVSVKRLNESVKRNLKRFPQDFMIELSQKEWISLRSQFATLESGKGRHSKYLAHAFTEHGVVMLSSVLNSDRAIQVNIFIVRAFISLRKMLTAHQEMSKRLNRAERMVKFHDQVLTGLVEDIKRIKNPPRTDAIGFVWRPKTKNN